MGGVFHLFDLKQTGTSKGSPFKIHSDGLEAPRNSIEVPMENSRSFHPVNNNTPYSYHAKHAYLGKNNNLKEEAMKNPSKDHLMKRTVKGGNVPGIVARLMGVDTFPSDINHSKLTNGKVDELKSRLLAQQKIQSGSIRHSPLGVQSSKQSKQGLVANNIVEQVMPSKNLSKTRKLQSREHQQAEELQKFKKKFEAWQATMSWERPKSFKVNNYMKIPKDDQILAQELLNREKMVRYADANQSSGFHLPVIYEKKSYGLRERYANEVARPFRNQATHLHNRNTSSELDQIYFERENSRMITKPSRIVILKPDLDRNNETEDSWHGSSGREECSLEAFLDQVKERLRLEIQDNSRRSNNIRALGVETPFKERPANAKDIARHIANHMRENIAWDLGVKLLHSESTKSCKKNFKILGKDSPEFINKDARKFLSKRPSNVLKNEIKVEDFRVKDSRTSSLANEAVENRLTSSSLNADREALIRNDPKDEPGAKSGSFRYQERSSNELNTGDISPNGLVRSLSAPILGMSFGKLLLEEPRVSTRAQIRRRIESDENASNEMTRTHKERSSLKGKMSNLRYSLTRKGKLFGKKILFPVKESATGETDSAESYLTTTTAVMNVGNTLDNSTELPPSPLSVSCSGHEDFSRRKDNPSPVSPLDVPFSDGNSVSNAFKEISSNLYELRQQLNRLQFDGWEEEGRTSTEDDPSVNSGMTELECEAQIYIRDVLIAAGLYEGCPVVTKPIQNWVFKEAEKIYIQDKESLEETISATRENHKVLFDLLNETLLTGIVSPTNGSRIMSQRIWPNPVVLHGQNLVDNIWQRLQQYIYPPTYLGNSLDNMVAYDLRRGNWVDMAFHEAEGIGKEVEWMIWADLVGEVTSDVCR